MKIYKKDLNENFKSKIKELNNLTIDQKKYNSLISNLISKMNLDESLEDDEKKNEDNKDEKPQKPQNQEQKTDKQEQEQQEMSIESGVPDLEQQTKESDQDGEEIQIEDNSKKNFKKNIKNNLGDLKYKVYTEEFDEIIKAENLESEEELNRLRKKFGSTTSSIKKFYF